jgi:predicted nucleotidyltransferase
MIESAGIIEVSNRIVDNFKPDKIILFGSYAYGSPDNDSDVDLLVILPFDGKPFRKSLEILYKIDPEIPVDIIVRNPADTIRRYREGDPLIREALDKGKVLYERSN